MNTTIDRHNSTSKLPAGLYFVATPIGNIRDITLRALDTLRHADILVCEDTRNTLNLLRLHGIQKGERRVISYHDHSGHGTRAYILEYIEQGHSVAYASDAGTPLIADPGYKLLTDCIEAGISVTTLPGASAVVMGLGLSGLPTDKFLFVGFLPARTGARQKALHDVEAYTVTLVFYESPHRITETLEDIIAVLGDRPVALCRELTKMYEEVRRGPASDVLTQCRNNPPRGEIVLVVDGNKKDVSVPDTATIKAALEDIMQTRSRRDAVQEVMQMYDLPRKQVYPLALEL